MSQYEPIKDPYAPYAPSQSILQIREFEPLQYGDPVQRLDGRKIKALGRWSKLRSSQFAGDLFLALIPLFFIVVAAIAACVNNKPITPTGAHVEQILPLLPSIFPIVFAALMGKLFKHLALYRAERGVTLLELERLVGCQSLFAAVERQFATRRLDFWGFSILALWALSPVGGQAALRILHRESQVVPFNKTLRYLPIEAAQFTSMGGADMASEDYPSYGPLYLASLRTNQGLQNSTMDLWGNVKIPDIDSLSVVNQSLGKGWFNVDYSHPVTYTSLLGLPVFGIPSAGNSSFEVLSRYNKLECPNVTFVGNITAWKSGTWGSSFKMSKGFSTNTTASGIQSFQLLSMGRTNGSEVNCTVAQRDVVSLVECQGLKCQVNAMRPSTVAIADRDPIQFIGFLNMLNQFPFVTIWRKSHASVEGSSPTEQWLINPDTNFTQIYGFVNLSSIDKGDLSQRIQILYNTFWSATFGAQHIVGQTSNDLSYYDQAPIVAGTSENISFNSTSASGVRYGEQRLHCDWVFVVLLLVTSTILLGAGLTSVYLKKMTLAPDILGYASSAAHDNPYFPIDRSYSTHLDGLERARALEDVKVIIGDVKGDSDVGHIAFAAVRPGIQRLRKGRVYS
ncbi:hypothetical protein BLS_010048 [Venturia inaequalis]|uniref:Uncharacterized protein n=1 Tax=Venturia inaequalis TaxID=5025 RepID=A0A8H3USG3_VENIN|nr:hypothetical protein EG328_003796 [Venturia inaequalis]KAE9979232.1 hypothetical protein BLS_010048 [Venturia inaequalis]RDI76743.1 hypothetical protein Vi05172_g13256 [Venturia inaequalis]